MTEEQLQEIEARAAAARPGMVRWMQVRSHGHGITLDVDTMPNAELIANSRQWVLALVAEVRRLRAALEAIEHDVQECYAVLKEQGCEAADYEDLSVHFQHSLDWVEGVAHNALHPEGEG